MGGMNPRAAQMEMQQRMMVRQQLRGQTMQQQQQQQQQMTGMLRPPVPDYSSKAEMMSGAQQQMMGQNPNQAAMMTRFNSASSGPGRPNLMSTPQQMSGVHRLPPQQQLQQQQQQQQPQQGNMYQQMQHRMGSSPCGPPGSVPSNMPMGNMNMNNMNMPMRRMSSYNPNGAPPGSIPNVNPGMAMNGGPMMNNSQQSQPGMGNMGNGIPPPEWMAMQQDSSINRNFPSMQQQQQLQQQQQGHRSNQNPSGFHPGLNLIHISHTTL